MKIAFYTLGCKVNQYETQSLREICRKRGHKTVSDTEDFDCIVINSCTVTAESDRKARQQLNKFKRENPNAVTVLTGCSVQVSDKTGSLPQADIAVGNTDLERIITLAEEFFANRQAVTEITPHTRGEKFNTPCISSFDERTRAYIKIEDGCERYCTYCIIPFARGFVRSKPLEEIRKEAGALAQNGYREIVLTGINLSAYGKGEDLDLCDAVEAVAEVEGIERVRLGSLEPDHISNAMLKRFKSCTKFCPQFHLSLQSGSDGVLKRMNRHYDTAFYFDLVTRIREIFLCAGISTDVMVGFPAETQEEFAQSLEFCRKVGFAKTHIFAYSRRKGTLADKMENQITKALKQERSQQMHRVALESEQAFMKNTVGQSLEVLFETEEEGLYFGYTPNYIRVGVKAAENLSGKVKKVKITRVNKDFCQGELI